MGDELIWPSDDPAFSVDTRRKLFPELGGYSSNATDFVKGPDPEAGPGHRQILDVWGRTRFVAELSFDQKSRYIAILMAFWRANRLQTFTFFDQDFDQHDNFSAGNTNGGASYLQLAAKEVVKAELEVSVAGFSNPIPSNMWLLAEGQGAESVTGLLIDGSYGSGNAVTMKMYGRRKYVCEFVQPPQQTSHASGRKRITFTVREA